jgi:hypothetical protein
MGSWAGSFPSKLFGIIAIRRSGVVAEEALRLSARFRAAD